MTESNKTGGKWGDQRRVDSKDIGAVTWVNRYVMQKYSRRGAIVLIYGNRGKPLSH